REEVLDLAREDVLAARDDHLVVASVDEQAPLVVEVPHITGGEQPSQLVLAPTAGVALEGHLVADEHAAGLALLDLVAILVDDLDHGPAGKPPSRARRLAEILRRGDGRPCDLRGAVEVVDVVPEAVHPLRRELTRERRAAGPDDAQV